MRVKKITIISILLLSVVFVVLSGCEIKKSNVNSKNDSETNNVEKVKKDNIETQNTERITEKKDEMEEIEYKELDDGTYEWNKSIYKYKLNIKDDNDETKFVVLANRNNITYQEVIDVIESSDSEAGDFVIVETK